MTETLDHTAQRIAERGREALLTRLRPAFREAAQAHSDVLSLDEDQLEEMVQRAADRADGLQWRRALAGVATEELEIGLGEALSHPAVSRAQDIVGAPSYEESLEALGPAREGPPAGDTDGGKSARLNETDQVVRDPPMDRDSGPSRNRDRRRAGRTPAEPSPAGPAPDEATEADPATTVADPAGTDHPVAGAEAVETSEDDERALSLPAVHLGGIANLGPSEQGIELRLSEAGLDIARGSGELLGRLRWPEIRALDVPPPKGLRRRRRGGAHLVIRTRHGDATFEIPEVSAEDLQNQLAPLVLRHRAS